MGSSGSVERPLFGKIVSSSAELLDKLFLIGEFLTEVIFEDLSIPLDN